MLASIPRRAGRVRPGDSSSQAETQPSPLIDLADYQVRRRPILDGLTSEYQIAA
jgi:hypothetical protein